MFKAIPNYSRVIFMVLLGVLLSLGMVGPVWSASWDPREVIHKYYASHYPWAEVEIIDIYGIDDLPKNPPIKVFLLNNPLGRAVFSFRFRGGEKSIIQAQIRALDYVATARRPFKTGHTIQKEDVYLALIDVRQMPRDAITRLEGAWGKTLIRPIEGNMPIGESALGDLPIIKKGQVVNLIVSSPGLKITTQGEARENGRLGQQIKVVNLSSKHDVRGIPIDNQNVQVIF